MQLKLDKMYKERFYAEQFRRMFPNEYLSYMQKLRNIKKIQNWKERLEKLIELNTIIQNKANKKIESKESFYNTEEWRRLRNIPIILYGKNCACCGKITKKSDLHVDHIKPRSIYPELELEVSNLQILCKDCNMKKSTKVIDYRTTEQLIVLEKYLNAENKMNFLNFIKSGKVSEKKKPSYLNTSGKHGKLSKHDMDLRDRLKEVISLTEQGTLTDLKECLEILKDDTNLTLKRFILKSRGESLN